MSATRAYNFVKRDKGQAAQEYGACQSQSRPERELLGGTT
jgi:hypothetical protein